MKIKTPKDWRKGQTLFNFLEWLNAEKGIVCNQSTRMADPFYLDDETLDKFFIEFMEKYEV